MLPLNRSYFRLLRRLKSRTRGYASFDYEITGYERPCQARYVLKRRPVRRACDNRSPRKRLMRAQGYCRKIKRIIPRQMFQKSHSGGYRRQNNRARNGKGAKKRRYRQMLAAISPAKAPRKQKRGQEDAPFRYGGDTVGGIHVDFENRFG